VTDADEARGQDVLEEELGEVGPADDALFGFVPVGAVLIAEGDALAVVVGDAGIGDCDAVDVAGKVVNDVAGFDEGCFREDVPCFRCALEQAQVVREIAEDFPGSECMLDLEEELSAELLPELLDWQEEPPRRRDPPRLIERQAAGGDYAMQVWMESELLVPGVQDGGESDRGLEVGAGDLG